MGKPRIVVVTVFAAAALTALALIVPSLDAQSADGALANFTPGLVKIHHTGGTVPSSGYTDLGRLAVPAGSFALTGHAVIYSDASAATDVDCFLVYPGTPDGPAVAPTNLSSATPQTQYVGSSLRLGSGSSDDSMQDLSLNAVTTSTSGGNVDLLCRATDPAAGDLVWARDVSVAGISVAGTTVTDNEPPAPGTY